MSNSVLDAAYLTAHDYPGGAKTLALRLGVNAAVLSNKLNPNNSEHHLSVRDLIAIMTMTGDLRAMHSICLEFGYVALPLPTIANETTTEAIADTCKEFGEFLHTVTSALGDGKITKLELRKIRTELARLIAVAGKLESITASMEAAARKGHR